MACTGAGAFSNSSRLGFLAVTLKASKEPKGISLFDSVSLVRYFIRKIAIGVSVGI